MRLSVAFISIYPIAWVKLTINSARSDTATFVHPIFLLARSAKLGQRPRCTADSTPGAGEALGGGTDAVLPLSWSSLGLRCSSPLRIAHDLTLSQRLQTDAKAGC